MESLCCRDQVVILDSTGTLAQAMGPKLSQTGYTVVSAASEAGVMELMGPGSSRTAFLIAHICDRHAALRLKRLYREIPVMLFGEVTEGAAMVPPELPRRSWLSSLRTFP